MDASVMGHGMLPFVPALGGVGVFLTLAVGFAVGYNRLHLQGTRVSGWMGHIGIPKAHHRK